MPEQPEPSSPRVSRRRRSRADDARRAELYASYDEAAADPVFMAEMRAITEEFEITVADGLEPY